MHFSAMGSTFGIFLHYKIWAIFHYCKVIFEYSFFFIWCVFEMKLNNFLVGSFLIEIALVIEFQIQRATNQILESFLNINTLWSFNLCSYMTPNFIYTIYNECINMSTRLYN